MDNKTMDELQLEIEGWNVEVFGKGPARARPTLKHLLREVDELSLALSVKNYEVDDEVRHEAADVAILLLALCARLGFSLREAIDEKMKINGSREWGKPDDDGVIEHVERRPP